MTVDALMAEIERDRIFYDESGGGVTFSGGEPLMQPAFVREMAAMCRVSAIHVALDTCGHVDTDALLDIARDVDLFLFDLKMMDEERHRAFTGASNVRILQNLERLSAVHGNILVRFPFIPGVNDDDENVRAMGAFLASLRLTRDRRAALSPGRHRQVRTAPAPVPAARHPAAVGRPGDPRGPAARVVRIDRSTRRIVMTERVARLRQQSLDRKPTLSSERAELMTAFYRDAPAAPLPILRALSFQYLMERKALCILPDELIVGERGPEPKATPTYPELCCHTLEDLDILDSREKISFAVDQRARDAYREIGHPVLARAVDAPPDVPGAARRVEARLRGGRVHRVHGAARARPHGGRREDLPRRGWRGCRPTSTASWRRSTTCTT